MKTKTYFNFLEPSLHTYLNLLLFQKTQHLVQISSRRNEKGYFLYGTVPYDNMMNFIFEKIQKTIGKKLNLLRVYSNLQFPGMDGDFHTDDGELTCMIMIHGDGDFEIKNEKRFSFVENSLIIFDASKSHKGHAPSKDYRITLAFKTREII